MATKSVLQKTIDKAINAVQKAEGTVKQQLAVLSRVLLEYVVLEDTGDIARVNRLLSVLTPQNKQAAIFYFSHFLPYAFDDKERMEFTTKNKKGCEKKVEAIREWLAVESNDIWQWSKDNLKIEKVSPSRLEKIEKDVKLALEKDGIDPAEVIAAVVKGGITIESVVAILQTISKE